VKAIELTSNKIDVGFGDTIITDQNIKNHGMPLEQVYSGSDAATIEILANVTPAREPILLYWWNPRDNTAKYDLKRVALPPVTDACRSAYSSNDGTYDCDFIPEHPVKIATFGLKESAPAVYAFLQQYELANDDYESMLAQIDEGDDVELVAANWVAENGAVWMPMLEGTVDDATSTTEATTPATQAPDGSAEPDDSAGSFGARFALMPIVSTIYAITLM
jgi:ABC-type proline/glycine betaine transport system substrate-binding protein